MLARLQWSAFGLRGRIVGAVLVTTVATLAVATIVLLSQLESSLKQAALLTLQDDVAAASKPRAELANLAAVNYRIIPERSIPSLRGTQAQRYAEQQATAFTLARNALQQRLGANSVVLIGYMDSSGRGKVVSVEPDNDSAIAAASSYGGIAKAYLTGEEQHGFGTVNGQQVVRAAIKLRGDDAVVSVYKLIDDIPYAVTAVRRAFEIAALAGLVLTMLLAIPLAATLVRRLQRLREAALRVAVEGAGAEFPLDRARDEVGDLARSFAIMQRRLRHQEEARRGFVATASHELRTPLASLDGMLELLDDDLRGPVPDLEEAGELLDRARVQSRRLGRLAADLLDLSRIDADVALRSEPIELVELARAVLAEFELARRERNVTGVLRETPGPVWALGDPGSVARILRILIDNALRVAPPGTEVAVELSARPQPTLKVIDSGPGVARDERDLIFERFKRGRDTGGEAGFGLGLAIGRELAERMRGALLLSDAPPPGATFVLTLPSGAAVAQTLDSTDRYEEQAPLGGGLTS